MNEHIILSEKPEDLKKASDWVKQQKEKQKRNDEVGEKLWKRLFPMLTGGDMKPAR